MKYLFTLLLLLVMSNHLTAQTLRPEIKVIIDSIASDGYYDSDFDFPGEKEKGVDFKKLSHLATDSELVQLTDHENPIIRAYSFRALTSRKGVALFPIILKLLPDTIMVHERPFGCIPTFFSVGEVVWEEIRPPLKKSKIKLTKEQSSIIDSFVLYSPAFSSSSILLFVLQKINPAQKFYPRIKELYTIEKNNDALPALAKYQKQEDKQYIIDILKRNQTEDVYYALNAVSNFPDDVFYPYLRSIYKSEMQKTEFFNRLVTSSLWRAIVQYKTIESRKMMENILATVNENGMEFHGIDIYLAIEEYPDPIFDGIQNKIHLNEIQQMEVQLTKKVKQNR